MDGLIKNGHQNVFLKWIIAHRPIYYINWNNPEINKWDKQ